MQLFSHFAPITAKSRANVKNPAYEEVAIPSKMAEYAADLRGIGGFLKPNDPMVNYVGRELAIGKTKVPSHTPFIAPNLADVPRPAPLLDTSHLSRNGNRTAKLVRPMSRIPFR